MVHAPDVRAAFHCLTRFPRVISDVISPEIDERGEQVVFRAPRRPAGAAGGAVVGGADGHVDPAARADRPDRHRRRRGGRQFQHPPPAAPERYRQALGCPVEFNAPAVSLVIKRSAFDLPLRRADQHLFAYLERHVRSLDARVAADTSIAARVRQHLVASVREGEPRQAAWPARWR